MECLEPPGHYISFYGWIFHTPASNSIEEDVRRRGEIVQLDSSAEGSGPERLRCTDQLEIKLPLFPSGLRDFDRVRASELGHSVERLDRDLDFSGAPLIVA